MDKTKNLNIRITEAEHELIKQKAESVNLSVSAYLRFVALNATVKVQAGK